MARVIPVAVPSARNRYVELLELERGNARAWPRHDVDLLADLEAGVPVVTWGFMAGCTSMVGALFPDGMCEPLDRSDPDAVAFLGRPA